MGRLRVILFALIIFVGSSIMALAEYGCDNDMGPGCMNPRIVADLNLTDKQSSRIQALREEYLRQTISFQSQIFTKQGEMRLLWSQSYPDQAKIMAVLKDLNAIRAQLQGKRVQYRLAFRKLLNPDQLARFMAIRPEDSGRLGPVE